MPHLPSSITVREILPEDHDRWRILWDSYLHFYDAELPQAQTDTSFARFLQPDEPVFAAVAVQGDALIGMVTCVLHRSTWSPTTYCYLEDLFVAPQARAAGAGTALIAWVQHWARAKACTRLYWHTQNSNLKAQRLYDKVAHKSGFIEYQMAL